MIVTVCEVIFSIPDMKTSDIIEIPKNSHTRAKKYDKARKGIGKSAVPGMCKKLTQISLLFPK